MPKDTRFKPGQSGNPKGKAKGIVHATTKIRKRLMEGEEEIIKKVLEEARNGDMVAIKLVLDKILPNATALNTANILEFDSKAFATARPADQLTTLLDQVKAGNINLEQYALLAKSAAQGNQKELGELVLELRSIVDTKKNK